jgi:hypothetical protein
VLESSKLEGLPNYDTRKFCVTSLLQRDELIDLVEPNVNGNFKVNEGEYVIDFERQKKRALAIINLSMKYWIVPHIAKILDPTTMWQTLKNLFEQQNGTMHLHFKIKLTNFRLKEGNL